MEYVVNTSFPLWEYAIIVFWAKLTDNERCYPFSVTLLLEMLIGLPGIQT